MNQLLETPRLILRDFAETDLSDLHEILGDSEVMYYCEPAYSIDKTQAFLTDFCISRKGAMACALKPGGKVIGYILFNGHNSVYEAGWIFNKSYWRQGYAYEICSALFDHAFTVMNARKITAQTIDTVKSLGMMQRLGMKQEGLQRKQVIDNNGDYADLYIYGILQEEYLKL